MTPSTEDTRCDLARTTVASKLLAFWETSVVPKAGDSAALPLALSAMNDLWDLSKTEFEKYDCAYEVPYADFVNAFSRVSLSPANMLLPQQIGQVTDALERASGSPHGPVPSAGSSTAALTTPNGLALGAMAAFPYFDVTVHDYRVLKDAWGVLVTVCYTPRPPWSQLRRLDEGQHKSVVAPVALCLWSVGVRAGFSAEICHEMEPGVHS